MKAHLAFLTSPSPGRYLFNYQEEGREGICQVEISERHLANIVIDGASHALRSSHRILSPQTDEVEHERAIHRS